MSAERARFGQLIYTSFDDGRGSGGGWRVKAETGDLSSSERQELTSRIVTRFDMGEPLPPYPSASQIAARPARLLYATLSQRSAAYWHTVDGGKDGTGRPGNVVAHVVLDRDVNTVGPLRPIELWGSAQWLRPYGPVEVAAAELESGDFPKPSGQITSAASVKFLTEMSVDQQSVFRVLLDAVHTAMSGGRNVLLSTQSLDSPPKWIAAVSYFMSPASARRFSWCSHDDPQLAASDLRSGVHLVAVARDCLADVPAGDWLQLDEFDEPFLGELGSTHGVANAEVAVTGWSVLAEGVLYDEAMASRVLARQDAIAAELGDQGLSLVWPLAVAVRQEPGLNEFHSEADRVIADDEPVHAESVDWIAAVVGDATAATAPSGVVDALERLVSANARGSGVAPAARRFLRLALADFDWLRTGAVAAVPAVPIVDVAPLQLSVDLLLNRLRQTATTHATDMFRVGLRTIDLLRRLGIPSEQLEAQAAAITGLITEYEASVGEAVCELTGDEGIGLATRERVLRPVVARLSALVLAGFDLPTWAWLFDNQVGVPEIPPNPFAYDCVLLPRYVIAALSAADRSPIEHRLQDTLATSAIFLSLGADDVADDECIALVDALSRYSTLSLPELGEFLRDFPGRIAPRIALNTLLYQQVPRDFIDVVAAQIAPPDHDGKDLCAIALARLRQFAAAPRPWSQADVLRTLDEVKPVVVQYLPSGHIDALRDEVVYPLAALFVIDQARGGIEPLSGGDAALGFTQRLSGHVREVAELVADMVEAGVGDVERLTAHVLLSRLGIELPTRTLQIDPRHGEAGLIEVVLDVLTERRVYRRPSEVRALRDAAWPLVTTLSADQAERFFENYSKVARDLLHDDRSHEPGSFLGFRRSSREER